MPKVTKVTKAPEKTAVKSKAPENPARTLKVLKGFTVDHTLASPDLIKAIVAAADKYGKVAVTAQGNATGLDRKMQQRVQAIFYRRGYDHNTASAIREDYVVACAKDPSKPKTEVQAPATPRVPKAKAEPAKKATPAKTTPAKAPVGKAERAGKGRTTRKATVKRPTDAKALYDATFGKADKIKADEIAAQAEADQKAQADAIAKLRAEKEAQAAESGTTPHDIVSGGVTILSVVAPDHDEQVKRGVADVATALAKETDPRTGLRIGMRGTEPVIETNYGVALGRPFKGRAVAEDVLAEIERVREEVSADA